MRLARLGQQREAVRGPRLRLADHEVTAVHRQAVNLLGLADKRFGD